MSVLGRQDLHCHTTFSDGALPLQEVVRIASELGVQVGIADHVSTSNADMFVATLDAAAGRRRAEIDAELRLLAPTAEPERDGRDD